MINKSNKKLKFGIVDGLVLLLAIVCISTIITRSLVIEDKYQLFSDRTCYINFEMDISDDISLSVLNNIKVGDSLAVLVKDNNEEVVSKVVIGSVESDVKCTEDNPNKALGKIIAKGNLIKNKAFQIEGEEFTINVGDELTIVTESAIGKIKIVSFEWK